MDHYIKNMFLIQTSSCIAEITTYPIDYIKTLMQIKQNKISFFNILWKVSQSENKLQIYNGIKPALLRHSIYTISRINIYENLRNKTSNKFLIAGFSGGISQLISSPFDLLKIRYITNINKGNQLNLHKTIMQIHNENGIRGLWRGATPNISRAVLVNFGELATYESIEPIISLACISVSPV